MRNISVEVDVGRADFISDLGISHEELHLAVNDGTLSMIGGGTHFVAIREFPGGRIIMVDGLIVEYEMVPGGEPRLLILEPKWAPGPEPRFVMVMIALDLRRHLPSGELFRGKDASEDDAGEYRPADDVDTNLEVIAKSFGFPVVGHEGEPPSTIYYGDGDGRPLRIIRDKDAPFYLCGYIDSDDLEYDGAWALDVRRYRRWLWLIGIAEGE